MFEIEFTRFEMNKSGKWRCGKAKLLEIQFKRLEMNKNRKQMCGKGKLFEFKLKRLEIKLGNRGLMRSHRCVFCA